MERDMVGTYDCINESCILYYLFSEKSFGSCIINSVSNCICWNAELFVYVCVAMNIVNIVNENDLNIIQHRQYVYLCVFKMKNLFG